MKKIALTLLSTLLFSTGAYAAKYKLMVPHVTSPESYNHQSLLVFKNFVESRSNGQIEVDIYPSGQLCSTAKECLAGVQAGMFDYFQTTIPELAYYWKPMSAFDLPYMLKDDRIAECVYDDGKFMADIRNNLLQKTRNLRIMMVSNSGGWRNIATTKKQVKAPDDVKGLKLRTVPAPIQQELVKQLGGSPTPIAWPEVYTALSTGVVDGTKNGIVDIVQMRFHESLKYIILDGHAYMGGVWVMNDNKFKTLPDDLKKIIIDGAHAQNQYLRSYPKWKESSAYQEFKDAGGKIYNPSEAEKERFRQATKPVTDYFLKTGDNEDKQWLMRFEAEIAACETKIAADDLQAMQ